MSTQTPQSIAAHLDTQGPVESPRAIFHTNENDPVKTLHEACLMVRKPALELLRCLKNTNFAHPAVRYLLYGEKGTGKTLSLCHVIRYCAKQDWLILHIPDAHTEEGKKELLFLSNANPWQLERICAYL
ncbi:28S ribosomal protein S29, mitochondrial-like [Carlito syrichta]|uniref:Small ribosomal subunit protein mS29 n=1 Tax=Carlito syrichta TaxID=1868482 RepID=A0A3Q0DJD9_CARSF|nr:28S ribosomal protein S29, mitochondrial-like [Carlito syrichta]